MIYSFIDISPEGLNTLAYTEALSAYYEKQVTYYMEIDYTDDLIALINFSKSRIGDLLSERFNEGKVIVYYQNEFFDIIKELNEQNENETMIYPQSFLDRYENYKLFDQLNKKSTPILLVNQQTVFEPLKNIIIPTDYETYVIENKGLIINLATAFNLEIIFSFVNQLDQPKLLKSPKNKSFFKYVEKDFKGLHFSFRFEKEVNSFNQIFKVTNTVSKDHDLNIWSPKAKKRFRFKRNRRKTGRLAKLVYQLKHYSFSYN